MSERPLQRLLVAASHYGVTSLLTMLAGLVSFPLLTRLFSVEDYGLMSVVAATITVAVALGKVGVQQSILRYHSEITSGKSRFTVPQLVSTTFFGMLATGTAVVVVLVFGARVIPARWLGNPRLAALLSIAGFLVVVQVLESALVNFLRAEQRTTVFMKYQVAKKYLTLGFIVVALLLVSRTLTGFYSASVIAEGISIFVLMAVLFRGRVTPAVDQFSMPLYRELIGFGIPMMIGYEMSGIVLAVGDRYVINGMIGEGPLGLYAAAYNLCQYVQQVVIVSVGQAIMPIYMQLWDREGKEAASRFISSSLSRYVMVGAPVIAGLAAVGPELLPSLASEKYASAALVLPWVIAGMVVDGTNSMMGAGLFIHRKTRHIMAIVLSCAILNIGLNILLVPRMGILGAAIATLVSYAITAIAMALAGNHLLPIALPWGTLLRSGAAAALMYLAVIRIYPGHRFLTVGLRAAAGGLVYGALLLAVDSDARFLGKKLLARLRKQS